MSEFLYELSPGVLGGWLSCKSDCSPLPSRGFTSAFSSFLLLCGFTLLIVSVVFQEQGSLPACAKLAASNQKSLQNVSTGPPSARLCVCTQSPDSLEKRPPPMLERLHCSLLPQGLCLCCSLYRGYSPPPFHLPKPPHPSQFSACGLSLLIAGGRPPARPLPSLSRPQSSVFTLFSLHMCLSLGHQR